MATVIFAGLRNAGRSQMASAIFNTFANPALAHAVSAGTWPGAHVHPAVADAMKEPGFDLSTARQQPAVECAPPLHRPEFGPGRAAPQSAQSRGPVLSSSSGSSGLPDERSSN